MPLTSKGEEIKSALTKEYGAEKGEQVLYAGKNKGTFKGIDANEKLTPDQLRRAKLSLEEAKRQLTTEWKREPKEGYNTFLKGHIEKLEKMIRENSRSDSRLDCDKISRIADAVNNLAQRFDAMVDARIDTVDLTNYSTAQLKKSLAQEWSSLTAKEKRDITAEIEKRGSKEYGAKHK